MNLDQAAKTASRGKYQTFETLRDVLEAGVRVTLQEGHACSTILYQLGAPLANQITVTL